MSIPWIGVEALRNHIGFEQLIDPVGQAYRDFSAGLAESGLITMFPGATADLGDVYVKTGAVRGGDVHVVKVSPWFALNASEGQPQGGLIAVFDSHTGHTLAIIDDQHYLSDIRTAAAGVWAARALAPEVVSTAAVFGTGVQAFWQTLVLYRERPFRELVVWGRDEGRAEALMERLSPHLGGVAMRREGSAEAAVRCADVLLTTTSSRQPIIEGEWLRPGQHITAIGADDATKCELDAACLRRADRLIVDSVESAISNGDVGRHVGSGAIGRERVSGEIGEVLAGTLAGRTRATDITIAKFIGLGVLDLAAAQVAVRSLP